MKNINDIITQKIVVVISISLFVLIVVLFVYDRYREQDTKWSTIEQEQKAMLISGDVIFTEGNSFKSDMVRIASGVQAEQNYSHCGFIIVEREEDVGEIHVSEDSAEKLEKIEVYVVHMSIDKGHIVKEPIDSFWSNNKVTSYAICRADGFTQNQSLEIALEELLLMQVKFDNSYDASQNQDLYCTELICYIFDKVGDLNLYPYDDLKRFIYPENLFETKPLNKIL
ncbi:MAG: YiiX/YebB-like N1pC/P60 family cysteine hydrolase [Rikenellaceae bacterium]